MCKGGEDFPRWAAFEALLWSIKYDDEKEYRVGVWAFDKVVVFHASIATNMVDRIEHYQCGRKVRKSICKKNKLVSGTLQFAVETLG